MTEHAIQPADVVAVLVSQQDRVQRRHLDAMAAQDRADLPHAHAAIDQDRIVAVADQQSIAGAATSDALDREPLWGGR